MGEVKRGVRAREGREEKPEGRTCTELGEWVTQVHMMRLGCAMEQGQAFCEVKESEASHRGRVGMWGLMGRGGGRGDSQGHKC